MPIVFQALAQTVGNSNEQDMRLHSTGQSWTKKHAKEIFAHRNTCYAENKYPKPGRCDSARRKEEALIRTGKDFSAET